MKNGKYIKVDQDGDFELLLFQPACNVIRCSKKNCIINIDTGENYGQTLYICEFVNNVDGTTNINPIKEEINYKVVSKSSIEDNKNE